MTRKSLLAWLLLAVMLLLVVGDPSTAQSQSSGSSDDDDDDDDATSTSTDASTDGDRDGESLSYHAEYNVAGATAPIKVKVQFYGESQCPFCRKFVTETWNEIWSDAELKPHLDYEYVPWGNAYFATDVCGKGPYSSGERACFYDHCIKKLHTFGRQENDLATEEECFKGAPIYQHSEKEGQVDIYESCIIHYFGIDKGVAFTYCAEGDLMDNTEMSAHELLMECAADADIDVDATENCRIGQGRGIEIANAKKTPSHPGVPYVVVEGNALQDPMTQTKSSICQALKTKGLNPLPSSCSDRILQHGDDDNKDGASLTDLWWKRTTW